MADLKISQLTDGGASQATDEYVVARSGSNFRIDGASVAAAATSVGTLSSLTVSGATSLQSQTTMSRQAGAAVNLLFGLRSSVADIATDTAGTIRFLNAAQASVNMSIADAGDVVIRNNLAVDTNTLYVDAANNRVGVGTASPGVQLEVSGSGTQEMRVTSSNGNPVVRLANPNNVVPYIQWNGTGTRLSFYDTAATAERMVIDASGNLGLGVTPSYQFDLLTPTSATDRQAVRINYGTTVGRAVYFGIDAAVTGTTYIQSATPSSVSSGTDLALNPKGGNVGVGTTSPGSRLHVLGSSGAVSRTSVGANANQVYHQIDNSVNGLEAGVFAAGNAYLASTGAYALALFTNGTERARITSGGYFKASNDGTYQSSTGAYHELMQTATGSNVVIVRASSNSYASSMLVLNCPRTTTNGTYNFIEASHEGVANRFIVADSGNVTNTNGSYGTISDIKHKQDVIDAPSQWDDLKAVRFRKYRMKTDVAADPNAPYQLGVIAQELMLRLYHSHSRYQKAQ